MCVLVWLFVFIFGVILLLCVFRSIRRKKKHLIDHYSDKKYPPTPHIGPDGKTVVWDMQTGEHKSVYTLILTGPVSTYFSDNLVTAQSTPGIVNYTSLGDDFAVYIDSKASSQDVMPLVNMIKGIPLYSCGLVSFTNNPPISSSLLSLTKCTTSETKTDSKQCTPNPAEISTKISQKQAKQAPPSLIFMKPMKPNFSWQPDKEPLQFFLPGLKKNESKHAIM